MPEPASARSAGRARIAVLGFMVPLLVLACIAVLRQAGGTASMVVLAALLILPLLLPLPGLWRGERRVHAWATLCLTPHFVYALTELVANPALRWLAAAMLVTSLGLAVALVACLRLTRPAAD